MNDMQRPAIDLVYDDLLATIEERDAALARVAELETARDYWRDRAEAAETERNTAARRAFNAEAENQRLQGELSAAEARAAELEAALAAERAAHQWRPFHVNGDHPIGVPIEAIVVVEDDNDNLTWGFDVRFWRPAAPQEPTP